MMINTLVVDNDLYQVVFIIPKNDNQSKENILKWMNRSEDGVVSSLSGDYFINKKKASDFTSEELEKYK